MPRAVKPTTRKYRSSLRAEQAQETRRRVLDAAAGLFIERGYAGTTVAAIAAEAGVSSETIYVSVGSKRALLEGVIDASIMGPEAPTPLEEQGAWKAIEEFSTASERLRAYVEFSCGVLARTSPIHAVIRGAAASEEFALELAQRLLRERLASNTARLRTYVAGELRPGLTFRQAAERYCALSSPELYHLVTAELGWTPKQHREWLAAMAQSDLLGPA
jgi:AcrR family transcriptional regulator